MRILLVDDNHELRATSQELLEERGHTVLSAASGAEALALVADLEPDETATGGIDLLLSDVMMPGMDGAALAVALARLLPRTKALFISAHVADPTIYRRLVGSGFEVLGKPFSPSALLAAIERSVDSSVELGAIEEAAPRAGRAALSRPSVWGGLAAAVLAVLSLGLGLWKMNESPPPLPERSEITIRRGGVGEGIAPVGEVARVPVDLEWGETPGAKGYELSLTAVDGTQLWSGEVAMPPAALPLTVSAEMHPAVVYYWSVVAFDASGSRLASSGPMRFRVDPRATAISATAISGGDER